MRRATDGGRALDLGGGISIHALLAESDSLAHAITEFWTQFLSTLSLRRATNSRLLVIVRLRLFLSTLSLRRATTNARALPQNQKHFYPRSPCGERHSNFTQKRHPLTISIHALLAESDCTMTIITCTVSKFLSTLSLRRATGPQGCYTLGGVISIHALLAESDLTIMLYDSSALIFLSTLSLRRATPWGPRPPAPPRHFYPRSPCGERLLF